ncbi:MAG: cell wall-binding repeat-containing protein [Actinobacteria bacterium]|nr:cell wall-binding repeat-containing protein [Actinomycetota bacterium]
MRRRTSMLAIVAAFAALLIASPAAAEDDTVIWFPVQDTGDVQFEDSWGESRGGRAHTGVDIMAPQMNEIYAAWSGEIDAYEGDCAAGEYCSSYYLLLSGDDGRSYFYVHLNNDTPGRPNGCDGVGGVEAAFAPRLVEELRARGTLVGVRVERGEHIAYNGSSGNAGCVGPHLHFEVWEGHGWGAPKVNPYPFAKAAWDAGNRWGADGEPEAMIAHGRTAGADRVATSVALSRAGFDAAHAVVIAPGGVYPEALVAAPLAAVLDGPVLLAWDGTGELVTDEVAAEIERLGASYAVLVGNGSRLPEAVIDELVAETALEHSQIRRIGGADRYELSQNVAREVLAYHGIEAAGSEPSSASEDDEDVASPSWLLSASADEPPSTVSPLVALGEHPVEGRGWPDALASSVLAARQQVPILLTRPTELPDETREILESDGIGEVRLAGGPEAIAEEVEEQIRDLGHETQRLAGADRYGTSLALAAETLTDAGVSPDRVYFATGLNFPDALASGSAVASLGHPLLLVHGQDRERAADVYAWLADRAGTVTEVVAIGGPAAVADTVLRKLATAAHPDS